jgi:hypothetical protein
MTRKPKATLRTKSNHRPFFDLLDQMEDALRLNGAVWPETVTADARRRLARLLRAVRRLGQMETMELSCCCFDGE